MRFIISLTSTAIVSRLVLFLASEPKSQDWKCDLAFIENKFLFVFISSSSVCCGMMRMMMENAAELLSRWWFCVINLKILEALNLLSTIIAIHKIKLRLQLFFILDRIFPPFVVVAFPRKFSFEEFYEKILIFSLKSNIPKIHSSKRVQTQHQQAIFSFLFFHIEFREFPNKRIKNKISGINEKEIKEWRRVFFPSLVRWYQLKH